MKTVYISDEFSVNVGEITEVVRRGLEAIGGIEEILEGKDTILVKPNFVIKSDKAITNPVVIEAVVANLVECGERKIVLGEAGNANMEEVFEETGMYDIARRYGIEVEDLNKSEQVELPVPDGLLHKSIPVARTAAESDLIVNVPVMKTSLGTMISIAMKNLKGVLTWPMKKRFHQVGLFESIVDLNKVLPGQLVIVDTTRAMEGNGPLAGDTVPVNRVVVARDSLAADIVCTQIMGFGLDEVPTIRLATDAGLGVSDPGIAGASIEEVRESIGRPFRRPPSGDAIRMPNTNVYFGSKTCTGCRMHVGGVLEFVKQQSGMSWFEGLRSVLDFYVGDAVPSSITEGHLAVVYGTCALKEARKARLEEGKGCMFVRGCPPDPETLYQAFDVLNGLSDAGTSKETTP